MTNRFSHCVLRFLVLILLPIMAHAETKPAVVLRDLHTTQLDLQVTASAYHRYQGSEGDTKMRDLLNTRLSTLQTAMDAAQKDLADLEMTDELGKLKGHWNDAAKNLNSAVSALGHGGFADGQVINTYLLNNLRATEDLGAAYNAVAAKTGYKVPAVVQALRNQALLFEEMCALYIEQSYEQYGYTYRSEAGNEDTLDKMAGRFDQNLDKLKSLLPTHGDEEAKLADVRTKWAFLRESFIKYNENSVPYLVVKFGADITGTLEELTKMQDKD